MQRRGRLHSSQVLGVLLSQFGTQNVSRVLRMITVYGYKWNDATWGNGSAIMQRLFHTDRYTVQRIIICTCMHAEYGTFKTAGKCCDCFGHLFRCTS